MQSTKNYATNSGMLCFTLLYSASVVNVAAVTEVGDVAAVAAYGHRSTDRSQKVCLKVV